MRNKCKIHCLDKIDLFGKEPELYYKGNSKRSSGVGKIFTILYSISYFTFLLY